MSMPKIMKTVAIATFLLTVIFALLHQTAIAITCGTTCYHFAMRLFVGLGLNRIMQNHADYTHAWFRLRKWESSLYRMLRVRKWKGKFPTYDPDLFDQRLHSLDEIAQAMCQAEIVHEIIAVLSFLPLAAVAAFGALPVFLITSILSACFDLCFVIMQRYNRPRVIKLMQKMRVQ